MNRLTNQERTHILQLLCEGMSIRAIERNCRQVVGDQPKRAAFDLARRLSLIEEPELAYQGAGFIGTVKPLARSGVWIGSQADQLNVVAQKKVWALSVYYRLRALESSVRRLFGGSDAAPHLVSLPEHGDPLNEGEYRQHRRNVYERMTIGRLLIGATGFVGGWFIALVGTAYVDNHRRCLGVVVMAVGAALSIWGFISVLTLPVLR